MTSNHKQHLKVRQTQMEIDSDKALPLSEDFGSKLVEAQSQLELLQQQQQEIESQKAELEEINKSKETFLLGQVEMQEKLTNAITTMEREIFSMRQELEELEQTRTCFSDHLEKIEHLNPEGWNNESLRQNLNRAISILDLAEDDYEGAISHFSGSRSGSLISGDVKTKRSSPAKGGGDISQMLRNGLAFNLPLIVLGIIALIVYYLK